MAKLRRAFFGLLAAFALLCGVGWTAAAYACPDTPVTQATDDGCTHSPPVSSVIPYCGPVCLGVVLAVAIIAPWPELRSPAYAVAMPSLHGFLYPPDPPPPRA